MDPDACLEELRELVAAILSHDGVAYPQDAADRLRELWAALDEWLERGGFLPTGWAKTGTGAAQYNPTVDVIVRGMVYLRSRHCTDLPYALGRVAQAIESLDDGLSHGAQIPVRWTHG